MFFILSARRLLLCVRGTPARLLRPRSHKQVGGVYGLGNPLTSRVPGLLQPNVIANVAGLQSSKDKHVYTSEAQSWPEKHGNPTS